VTHTVVALGDHLDSLRQLTPHRGVIDSDAAADQTSRLTVTPEGDPRHPTRSGREKHRATAVL
jgi:hypothetical protein